MGCVFSVVSTRRRRLRRWMMLVDVVAPFGSVVRCGCCCCWCKCVGGDGGALL